MNKFIIRLLINAVGLYVALAIVPGIEMQSQGSQKWIALIVLAFIFGLLNALLRPLVVFLTCPLIVLTLGLGTLLINTLMFYLTGRIGEMFGWGFTVDGFVPAFLGALVVSAVSFVLSMVLRDELKGKKKT